jgi:hypothetical protein
VVLVRIIATLMREREAMAPSDVVIYCLRGRSHMLHLPEVKAERPTPAIKRGALYFNTAWESMTVAWQRDRCGVGSI